MPSKQLDKLKFELWAAGHWISFARLEAICFLSQQKGKNLHKNLQNSLLFLIGVVYYLRIMSKSVKKLQIGSYDLPKKN